MAVPLAFDFSELGWGPGNELDKLVAEQDGASTRVLQE